MIRQPGVRMLRGAAQVAARPGGRRTWMCIVVARRSAAAYEPKVRAAVSARRAAAGPERPSVTAARAIPGREPCFTSGKVPSLVTLPCARKESNPGAEGARNALALPRRQRQRHDGTTMCSAYPVDATATDSQGRHPRVPAFAGMTSTKRRNSRNRTRQARLSPRASSPHAAGPAASRNAAGAPAPARPDPRSCSPRARCVARAGPRAARAARAA